MKNINVQIKKKNIFRVRPQIPVFKDAQPLLEIDRDERKLDVFLTFHRSSLLVSDMKIFLPFTINLDPYIKKKIKEDQQGMDDESNHPGMYKWNTSLPMGVEPNWPFPANRTGPINRHARVPKSLGAPHAPMQMPMPMPMPMQMPMPIAQPQQPPMWARPGYEWQIPPWISLPPPMEPQKPLSAVTTLPVSKILFYLTSRILKLIFCN